MKKFLAVTLGVLCASAIALHAEDTDSKPKLTPEQKAVKKEMLEKYDTNKDGKLSKEEREKISPADKEKMEKAGLTPHHAKKHKEGGEGSSSSTNAPAK